MDLNELRALIETKKTEVRSNLQNKEADKAAVVMEEVRTLKTQLAIQEELDEDEKDELRDQATKKKTEVRTKGTINEMRAAVKYALKGKTALTEEERAAVNIDNNAAILPEQFINDIQVLREGFPSLKQHCHIVKATSNHGKMPFAKIGGKKLTKYKSGTKLTGEAAATEEITYIIENYGSLVPIANDLQEDEAVNIVQDVIKPDFAEAAVNSENDEILTIVESSMVDKSTGATDYKGVKKVIDGVLPTLRAKTIVITNLSGYVYLKSQRDKNDRDLELVKNVNGVDYFENKPLVTLSDEELAATEGKLVFYVVNLYALVKFFERKGYTVSTDSSVFFESDEVALKVQERFDCEKLDDRACFKVEFTAA
ncbi:MAG: phage major capsid protein [Lachnotalea sp.]